MTRTYDRETKHYDFAVLTHLVETGQATFFEGPGIYVIKTEDGTVAVRPHQVVFTPIPAPFTLVVEEKVASPMDGYCGQERYDGEDTGPGGVVYDQMVELAERWIAVCGTSADPSDPLVLVRRMLDDPEGEFEQAIREQVDEAAPVSPRRGGKRSWVSAVEQEEILGYFGI